MLFKICTLCRVQHSTLVHQCAVYCSGKVALHSNTPSGTCSSSSYPHVSARGDLCFCTAYTLNIHCKYIAHTNFRTHSATQDNHHVLARGNLCFCTAYTLHICTNFRAHSATQGRMSKRTNDTGSSREKWHWGGRRWRT